ncbi:MAG: hypothetical protein HOO97_04455 [Sideroxydans sp.]|nr:hypothetical protein [Sideroxydans sp.]
MLTDWKSGRVSEVLLGMQAFNEGFNPDRLLLVGGAIEYFLSTPISKWVN